MPLPTWGFKAVDRSTYTTYGSIMASHPLYDNVDRFVVDGHIDDLFPDFDQSDPGAPRRLIGRETKHNAVDPGNAWWVTPYTKRTFLSANEAHHNDRSLYVSNCVFRPDPETGRYRAMKALIVSVNALLLDDLGEPEDVADPKCGAKVDINTLPPAILERAAIVMSSPGCLQAQVPLHPTAADDAAPLFKYLARMPVPIADTGGLTLTRWMRLPGGIHGKIRADGSLSTFKCRSEQTAGEPFTIDEVRKLLAPDYDPATYEQDKTRSHSETTATFKPLKPMDTMIMQRLQDADMVLGPRSATGYWPVPCPGGKKHSPGSGTTAGYNPDRNDFNCLHDHAELPADTKKSTLQARFLASIADHSMALPDAIRLLPEPKAVARVYRAAADMHNDRDDPLATVTQWLQDVLVDYPALFDAKALLNRIVRSSPILGYNRKADPANKAKDVGRKDLVKKMNAADVSIPVLKTLACKYWLTEGVTRNKARATLEKLGIWCDAFDELIAPLFDARAKAGIPQLANVTVVDHVSDIPIAFPMTAPIMISAPYGHGKTLMVDELCWAHVKEPAMISSSQSLAEIMAARFGVTSYKDKTALKNRTAISVSTCMASLHLPDVQRELYEADLILVDECRGCLMLMGSLRMQSEKETFPRAFKALLKLLADPEIARKCVFADADLDDRTVSYYRDWLAIAPGVYEVPEDRTGETMIVYSQARLEAAIEDSDQDAFIASDKVPATSKHGTTMSISDTVLPPKAFIADPTGYCAKLPRPFKIGYSPKVGAGMSLDLEAAVFVLMIGVLDPAATGQLAHRCRNIIDNTIHISFTQAGSDREQKEAEARTRYNNGGVMDEYTRFCLNITLQAAVDRHYGGAGMVDRFEARGGTVVYNTDILPDANAGKYETKMVYDDKAKRAAAMAELEHCPVGHADYDPAVPGCVDLADFVKEMGALGFHKGRQPKPMLKGFVHISARVTRKIVPGDDPESWHLWWLCYRKQHSALKFTLHPEMITKYTAFEKSKMSAISVRGLREKAEAKNRIVAKVLGVKKLTADAFTPFRLRVNGLDGDALAIECHRLWGLRPTPTRALIEEIDKSVDMALLSRGGRVIGVKKLLKTIGLNLADKARPPKLPGETRGAVVDDPKLHYLVPDNTAVIDVMFLEYEYVNLKPPYDHEVFLAMMGDAKVWGGEDVRERALQAARAASYHGGCFDGVQVAEDAKALRNLRKRIARYEKARLARDEEHAVYRQDPHGKVEPKVLPVRPFSMGELRSDGRWYPPCNMYMLEQLPKTDDELAEAARVEEERHASIMEQFAAHEREVESHPRCQWPRTPPHLIAGYKGAMPTPTPPTPPRRRYFDGRDAHWFALRTRSPRYRRDDAANRHRAKVETLKIKLDLAVFRALPDVNKSNPRPAQPFKRIDHPARVAGYLIKQEHKTSDVRPVWTHITPDSARSHLMPG